MDFAKHIKPLKGESDWPIWKRKIRDMLDYHEGALDAIDNKLVEPQALEDDATISQIKNHKEMCDLNRKANSYAKSVITSAVTDEVYQKIMDKKTAHEAWEALKQLFEATSKDQLFKICTDFFAFRWMSGEDVSTHIAKLRSLWSELNNGLVTKGENTLPDLILVCKILHILPHQFEMFRSSWLLLTKDTEKTFDELTMQLCMFERNFKTSSGSELVEEALTAKTYNRKQGSKLTSSKTFSGREGCCNYCKVKGHWVRECKKWIADGRPVKNKGASVNQNTALCSTCNEVSVEDRNSNDWWIDNGATKHVTNCSDLFVDFKEFESPCIVKAAGEEILKAIGKGKIKIMSSVNGQSKMLTLKDVWYVPKITRNLFSVLAAQDRNPNSEFRSKSTSCWLKINKEIVLCGFREIRGTLYKAAIKPIVPKHRLDINIAVGDSMLQLYHERWGHQDKQHVKNMLERELGIKVKLEKEVCEPCMYGKSHRLSFGTRIKATKPGELISTDVCGPFAESFAKKRYLVVFKDSYTKFRYGFVVKKKSEVANVLKEMLAHAKKQGHSIKELLSDNGGEFDNEEIKFFLKKEGITQRLTAPYTPEQNGGSERENRTIVEMARTFKYSNMDITFPEAIWAELVNSAVYILNRTGKSSEKDVTPYKLWMGKKPRIKHLRIIGSTCYIHVPIQKRKKMDVKAIKGYLVGYDGDERYRLYVKEDHKVVLSRDVQFKEKLNDFEEKVRLPKIISEREYGEAQCEEKHEEVSTQTDIRNNEESETKNDIVIQNEEKHEEVSTQTEIRNNEESETKNDIVIKDEKRQCLRDHSLISRPKFLNDFVMTAEEFINVTENPETFEDVLSSKQSAEWIKAMDSEIESLKENKTWKLILLPKGTKAIPCKWVFRLKLNSDGSIDKYKARLVVKGFRQKYGIDYCQTFSPVAKMGTIRSILSIAANEQMHLAQFDVSTAFLYGELEETIYMKQPEGYDDGTEKVCELEKSLYGLKQAPRCWNKRFGGFLLKLGFKASNADPCLFIKEENGKKLILGLYVDDGLVAATDQRDLEVFLENLRGEFKIVSKKAVYFLGLEIDQQDGNIKISQKAYAKKILERFNFTECNNVSTPMLKSPETLKAGKDEVQKHTFPYRQAVGALMYLMLGTRPDLAYSVGFLSRTLENSTLEDVARVKRVFRYIAGTIDLGIIYRSNASKGILECFSDADFGGCTKTGRSTSGVVVTYAGGVISWMSQRQAMVATSTTEAEIVAANEATKEVIWLSRLFEEIVELKHVPVLQVDNSAAVRLAQNPEFHRRTKHIGIKHFFIREKVAEGKLGIQQISTEEQVADIMTKPLSRIRLNILCNQMGLL